MKGGTVQINWHDTKPVLTLDFHPFSGLLATGGADFDIKIWQIDSGETEGKVPTASFQTSLSYHSSAVNVLRFSPSGQSLASGADGGELILWKSLTTDAGQAWKVQKTLLHHHKDVLDLQWSRDGAFLISGSVDNSCIIWDADKGSVLQTLHGHLHYVQGVAWDPLSKYVTSLSSDRTCRIYINKPEKAKERIKYVCQHVLAKTEQQTTDDAKCLKNHLFHDETLPSFFRRLAWSPDGSFLVVPAGSYKFSPSSEPVNTAYIFSRQDLSKPALQLPGASKPVIAVCFCPLAFSLRGSNPASAAFFKLPYRLIFAVATLNSLYIYDTESLVPLAILAGLHYASITDLAWSPDGKYLAVSSQDGYCTLVEFQSEELGFPVPLAGGMTTTNCATPSPSGRQKPEEMAVEASQNDSPLIIDKKQLENDGMKQVENNGMKQAKDDEEKQALPAATSTPATNKPAKRRITPIAIDP